MPRYFFNVVGGSSSAMDPGGADLPELESAQREAVLSPKAIVGDELRSGGSFTADRRIEVADEGGKVVFSLSFTDAIYE